MIRTKKFKIGLVYISALVGLSVSFPASSQTKLNCTNPGSNVEYKACAYQAYQESDKQLNRVYKSIFIKLKGTERTRLIQSQSLWIKFRDANCDFEVYRNRDGTGYGGFLSNCLERMTKTRIGELESWNK
jgi:uncharacterized protein YecT (DUF1311 family)